MSHVPYPIYRKSCDANHITFRKPVILIISLLYILVEGNILNLIRLYSSNLSYFEVEDKYYRLLFFIVLAIRSNKAIRIFLET
jgi:hypothetical protein